MPGPPLRGPPWNPPNGAASPRFLTTATMVLNANVAVSDVQVVVVVVVLHPENPGGMETFPGKSTGKMEGWFRFELRNWDLKVENLYEIIKPIMIEYVRSSKVLRNLEFIPLNHNVCRFFGGQS